MNRVGWVVIAAGAVVVIGAGVVAATEPFASGCVSEATGRPLDCSDLLAVDETDFRGEVDQSAADHDSRNEEVARWLLGGGLGLGLVGIFLLARPALRVRRSTAATEPERVEVNKAGIGLAAVGAAAMLIATFLPRVESTKFFEVVENTLVASGDGFLFIGLAVVVVAATYRIYQQGRQSWSVLILGLVGIGLAIYSGTGDRLELESVGPTGRPLSPGPVTEMASPGVGISAAGAGAALVTCGGLLLAGRGIWGGGEQGPARRTKTCPDCAETVLADARVCKHCGFRFSAESASA